MSLGRLATWAISGLLISTVAIAASSTASLRMPGLSFSQRVEVQRAIDRVYYDHQIGAILPFDQQLPDELLEKKVRLYLKQSAALATIWNTPVTAGMLRAEWERIARSTRMPERLTELYAALGDDPILIQECLVRPVLVDRLVRNFYSNDRGIHSAARLRAEELHKRLSEGGIESNATSPVRMVADIIRDDRGDNPGRSPRSPGPITLESAEFDRMRATLPSTPGEIPPPAEESDAFVIRELLDEGPDRLRVATWRVQKTTWDEWWATIQPGLDDASIVVTASDDLPAPVTMSGSTGCVAADSWSEALVGGPPRPRAYHVAVWTGSLMIVWGGEAALSTGGRYDPATDTWRPTNLVGAPAGPLVGATAVWTGSLMVVWGGSLTINTGGRYDPVGDRWLPVSQVNAPTPRAWHTAVWSGSEMLVWGGVNNFGRLASGGRYDPVSDSWTATTMNGAPVPREEHTAVWTGSRMVVWGGRANGYFNDGALYDPVADTWVPVAGNGAPAGRSEHTAVFDGSRMIIWGGWNAASYFSDGARYDPAGNSWSPIATTGAPARRRAHTAVWTGSRMIIWGGVGDTGTGAALYDPVMDHWTPSTVTEPAKYGHTALWTGSRMIVWGGRRDFGPNRSPFSNLGFRYDPVTDSSTPTSSGDAAAVVNVPGVWTGSLMVLWGSDNAFGNPQAQGARYDPVTEAWSPTTQSGAPSTRLGFSLVWAGSVMVVWGGTDNLGTWFNTGARYDPLADAWTPTSTTQAPTARSGHSAVWTGSVMVVWGGMSPTEYPVTGGRYDPLTDSWSPTRTSRAPDGRLQHTAVWTGAVMVVWGGTLLGSPGRTNTGGRYDPVGDRWDTTSLNGAPDGRVDHTAVWTGSRMVVWGGSADPITGIRTNTGGRYDPSSDTWLPTSTLGAPPGRDHHTATWLIDRMMIWGGAGFNAAPILGGGLYDPATDTWGSANTAYAPPEMTFHVALSLGDSMLVRGTDGAHPISGGHYFHAAVDSDADLDGASLCAGDCDDTNAAVYPGAAQSCGDGVNNDCLSPSWPSLGQTNEGDDDGDGLTECTGDCSDADPSSWALPGEVASLDLMPDASTLVWSAPSSPGGTLVKYDTLRSNLGSDFVAPATCVETADPVDLTAQDPLNPSPGEAFFYAVRGSNGCGSGTLGFASDGSNRPGRTCL